MDVERNDAVLNQFVATHLKLHRERTGITQDKLARLLGVKILVIQNAELGVQRIPAHSLYEACQVFGISLRCFFRNYTDAQKEIPAVQDSMDLPDGQSGICAQA